MMLVTVGENPWLSSSFRISLSLELVFFDCFVDMMLTRVPRIRTGFLINIFNTPKSVLATVGQTRFFRIVLFETSLRPGLLC